MSAKVVGWIPGAGRLEKSIGPLARIGATAENDIVVRVDGVSRTHAKLIEQQDGYYVEDAGSRNGTWLNGERISRAKLRHLDVITLGRFADIIFVAQAAESPVPVADDAALSARLEWLDGPERGKVVDIPRGEVIIGRAESCGIVIDSPAVSRAHARLTLTAEGLSLEDLGSVNGTFVQGRALTGATSLESGAEIELGQARRFRVILEGTPSPAAGPRLDGATPAGAQDMEWSTRLVWSATDLAAQSGSKVAIQPGPSRPHEAPTPATVTPAKKAPPVEEVAKQTGEPTVPVDTGQTKLTPSPLAPPPAVLKQDTSGHTELAAPRLGPPPRLDRQTEVGAEPSTQLGGGEAARVPTALRSPQDRTELPPATVLGFRDVGPTPRGVGVGPASTAFRSPAARDETVLPAPSNTPPPPDVSDAEPAMIESARFSGDLGVFVLPRGTSTVGRAADATIRIDSREMSRIHAVVTVTEHEVAVEDRGSVNGTSVNGTAITGRRSLVHGDRVCFADFEFRVEFQRTEGHS